MTRLTLLAACCLCAAPAFAQTDSHRRAAETLLQVTEVQEMFEVGVRLGMDTASTPEMESMRPVLEAFFQRYVSWDAVREQYVDLYVDTFTEAELDGLAAFYRTPLGQRVVEEQAHMTREGAQIGQEIVEAHQAELMVMIMQAMNAEGDAAPSPGSKVRK